VLPGEQQLPALEALTAHPLGRLKRTTRPAQSIGDEIRILSSIARSFANALSDTSDEMESGCDTSPDKRVPIPQPLLGILYTAWPSISQLASRFAGDDGDEVRFVVCAFCSFQNMHSLFVYIIAKECRGWFDGFIV
jgi:hypothetical protein